jgi:tetratricopeptide (TPR) repeat protein
MIAAQALAAGRADDAGDALFGVLQRYPEHAEVLRVHAGILSLFGVHDEAIAVMRRALHERPDDPLYHNTSGTILATAGHYDDSATAFHRACELDPALAAAWYNLGVLLVRFMRTEEAANALRAAVRLEPENVGARVQLADLLRMSNQADAATAEYRSILARWPHAGMAWWGLADLKTRRLSAQDVHAMQAAIGDSRATTHDVVATGFALARALDDQGRLEESLAALAQAHATARRVSHWDARSFSATIDALDGAFSGRGSTVGGIGDGIIFVVSLPRSGSTLLEQILSSHPRVVGAGELPDLPLVISEEERRRGRPLQSWAAQATADDWRRLGLRYLERTARWTQERPMLVDKLPSNWYYIDAIRAMLPGARVVVARREPLEACFSCYRQFLTNNEYTRTFADLASYWRDFDRYARSALARDAGQTRAFEYEQLLDDPEREIRELLAFCGLPFDPACLEFHNTEREVRTPSAMQVREPLRHDTRHSIRYGALLDPLRHELGLAPFAAT